MSPLRGHSIRPEVSSQAQSWDDFLNKIVSLLLDCSSQSEGSPCVPSEIKEESNKYRRRRRGSPTAELRLWGGGCAEAGRSPAPGNPGDPATRRADPATRRADWRSRVCPGLSLPRRLQMQRPHHGGARWHRPRPPPRGEGTAATVRASGQARKTRSNREEKRTQIEGHFTKRLICGLRTYQRHERQSNTGAVTAIGTQDTRPRQRGVLAGPATQEGRSWETGKCERVRKPRGYRSPALTAGGTLGATRGRGCDTRARRDRHPTLRAHAC